MCAPSPERMRAGDGGRFRGGCGDPNGLARHAGWTGGDGTLDPAAHGHPVNLPTRSGG